MNAHKIAQKLLMQCEELAKISEWPDSVLRQYLTPEHKAANKLVAQWMCEAGLVCWHDEVGNIWGRLISEQPDAEHLVLGSHLDTVPNAGKYDGILGVLMAIEAAKALRKQGVKLPFHLDIVGFADEEGTRFGTTLIGSQAVAGHFNRDWLNLTDAEGTTLLEAMQHFELNPGLARKAALKPDALLGYWEVHIEQGPVLASQNCSVGIVTSIAGARRARISVQGKAGHAGTTPMHLRNDAAVAAAELTLAIESLAQKTQAGEVATVGSIQVPQGAANVIAGQCDMLLDVRAGADANRDELISAIEQSAQQIAEARGVSIRFDWYHKASAEPCSSEFQSIFEDAAQQLDIQTPHLPSGAGHDAMAMAAITPIGMLFVRSPNGISHNPEECVYSTDVAAAFSVLHQSLMDFSRRYQGV
ncbi:allantoate amidohydrolase [Reinekea marinisedimentorum]|nr:allantoate amidohydrolase [Reinekea marinisedimentorum]